MLASILRSRQLKSARKRLKNRVSRDFSFREHRVHSHFRKWLKKKIARSFARCLAPPTASTRMISARNGGARPY
jgi:hypothetical protein